MKMVIRSMKYSLTLMILYLSVLISSGYALAKDNHPNILVLNSYHQGEDWTDNEIAGIFSEFVTKYPTLVPLVETLDTKRCPTPAHLDFLKDYLLRKYHDRKIDLIIALDNSALNLITQNPTELFPDVPVIFAGINGFRPEMIANRKKITGVVERQDVAGTLKMALAMHPKVSRIMAVHDYTASGLAVRQETETALAEFAGKLQISYSADVPFDTLSEELKEMPDNGLVLILTYVTDKAGHTFSREESTRLITSLSPAPVYAMHETRLGFGIMGGLLLEGKEHGRQAARLAFRVLQGEDPDRIAVEESQSRSILDYEGLRRFQIPEDHWPKDALVVNRPISFWSLHKNVLIPSIAAIIVLLGLSSMLLGTVIRLRRAKKKIYKSEEKYRVLFDSFPLGITVSDQDGNIVETNAMATTILGVPKEEHETRTVYGAEWRIIRTDGTPMPVDEYAATRALHEKRLIENVEMGIVKPDAGITWINVTAAPLNLENYGVVVSYLDVSARRGAEEELRDSEAKFRAMVETFPLAIHQTVGVEQITEYVNPTMVKLFGYTQADIPSVAQWWPLAYPDETYRRKIAEEWTKRVKHAIATQSPIEPMEVVCTCKDGSKKNISWKYITLGDKNYSCGLDITERKQAEAKLAESEGILRDIVESTLSGFWDWNLVANTEYLSPTFKRMFGYKDHEMENSPESWQKIIFPEDLPGVFEMFDRHVKSRGQQPFRNEIRYRHRDGSIVWVICAGRVVEWAEDGTAIRMVGCHIDITERKQAEEALRESQQFNKQIIQSANEGIIVYGPDLRYQAWNSFMEQMTGIPASEVLGKYPLEMFPFLQETEVIERLEKVIAGQSVDSIEFPFFLQSTGKSGWTRDNSASFYNEKGEIVGVIGLVSDITESKRLEEAQEKLQAQLQQAQKMEAIGTLAGGIAHDFNNILGAVIGYTEMAIDSTPPDSIAVGYLEKVEEASRRAASLVKQILAFSRQANTEDVALQPAAIIKEAIKILRPSLPSTITIKQQIDTATKSIFADPTQVHQILMNLCTNAYHAMEERGGTLEISLEDRVLSHKDLQQQTGVSPGSFVVLTIGDSGPGITSEIRDKIFDPYFTTKEVGKGTGMGLAIVHGIIKRYAGFITCETVLGKGTVFHVYFPAIEQVLSAPGKILENVQPGKERILFIDDEEFLVDLGKTVLERLGYEVTVRTSSMEAWNTFKNQPDRFDIVITDQTMPGVTGSDLALKMLQLRPNLPIILCTGYSSIISEKKAKSMGIKGFAMKPMVRKEIALLIRQVLDNKTAF